MKMKKLIPLVTTGSLVELKDFYSRHFDFRPTMESAAYLGLISDGGGELAFMIDETKTLDSFEGKGLTLCFEVDNVDTEASRLIAAKLPVAVPLQDNPWGDRSIIFRDPIGIYLYVYQLKTS
jgi:uncharacterized glyoxalase superfamily protein PhnB